AADPLAQARSGRRRAAPARALSPAVSGLQRPAFPPARPAPARGALLLCVRQEGPAGCRPGGHAPAPGATPPAPRAARLLWGAPASRRQSPPLAGVAPRAVVHPHRGGRRRHQALALRRAAEGGESVAAILTALRAVLTHDGVPMALYTDRAHWAVHTPT